MLVSFIAFISPSFADGEGWVARGSQRTCLKGALACLRMRLACQARRNVPAPRSGHTFNNDFPLRLRGADDRPRRKEKAISSYFYRSDDCCLCARVWVVLWMDEVTQQLVEGLHWPRKESLRASTLPAPGAGLHCCYTTQTAMRMAMFTFPLKTTLSCGSHTLPPTYETPSSSRTKLCV